MTEEKMPDGYYHEIPDTTTKKDEILECCSGHEIVIHSNAEEDYDFLADGHPGIEVRNPFPGGESLYIDLDGTFTLSFHGWHAHYDAYEYDYGLFLKRLKETLSCQSCAVICFAGAQWVYSVSSDSILTRETPAETFKELISGPPGKEYREMTARIDKVFLYYWNPEKDFIIFGRKLQEIQKLLS